MFSSTVIPFVFFTLTFKLNSNVVDGSLAVALILLWSILGIIFLREYVRKATIALLLFGYFILASGFILKAFSHAGLFYSLILNLLATSYILCLPYKLGIPKSKTSVLTGMITIIWFLLSTWLAPKDSMNGMSFLFFFLSLFLILLPIRLLMNLLLKREKEESSGSVLHK